MMTRPDCFPRLFLFCSLGFLAVNLSSAAPLRWRWSNPRPHGNNIVALARNGQGLIVEAGERGQIFTSDDLQLWVPRDSGTTNFLRSATFFNNRIIITGENGTVLWADSPSDFHRLDLQSGDWLEGVAASPAALVAVGDNAAIYTSPDGIQWTRRAPPFSDWLRSVSFGTPAGTGRFVAVGENGAVAVSSDGIQWQALARLAGANLDKVLWLGDQFWVVGDAGTSFVSSAGLDWTPLSTGATNDLYSAALHNGTRVATGEGVVRLQTGRGAWTDQLDPSNPSPPPDWTYFQAIWDGSAFLLAGRTGMMVEGFQTNANSPTFWLPLVDSPRTWLWEIKRFPNLYLAVGDRATVMSSLDGIDWSVESNIPAAFANSIFLGLGGKTNLAVAVGSAGSIITSTETFEPVVRTNLDGTVVTNQVSTLGLAWTGADPRPTTNDLQGITQFGDLLVATGGGGTILTGTDGQHWAQQTTPTTRFLSSVAAFSGGLVCVGDQGTILASPDAVHWSARRPGTTNWLFRVRNLGGKLIAVGQNGTILTSLDGSSWSQPESGTDAWLNDVDWVDGTYYAVGTRGTVLTSPDAVTWTDIGTITEKSLYSVAHDQNQLVVGGVEGVVLRTHVAPQTTPILLEYTHSVSTDHLHTNHFVFSGQPDQRFTLDRALLLPSWQTGPTLEFLDSSGFLTYTEVFTNTPSLFFRAKVQP